MAVEPFRRASELSCADPARTDDAGRFRLDFVSPGALTLKASGVGHLAAEIDLDVAPGEQRTGVTIEVARGAVLAVRATDSRGEPLRDVAVEVLTPARRELGRGRTAVDGVAAIAGLPAGTVVVRGSGDALVPLRELTVELSGTDRTELELAMVAAASVSLFARDESGAPRPGTGYELRRVNEDWTSGAGPKWIGTTIDSRDGTPRVQGLARNVTRNCRKGLLSAVFTFVLQAPALWPVALLAPRYSTTTDVPAGSDLASTGVR